MATISSAGENDFIKSLVNLPANGEEYWLGGSQPTGSATGDNWTWENGEGVFFNGGAPVGGAYVNWLTSTSEPSGDGDYVAMWADDNRFFGPGVAGFWNDEQVGVVPWISGYVLESIDPVPEPGTLGLLALGTLLFATRRRHAKA